MHRKRKVGDADAVLNPSGTPFFVFEYGTIRVQEPNPIEFLIEKVNKKFVFSDHRAERTNTWVYTASLFNESDIIKTIMKISGDEGYGKFLGHYRILTGGSEPDFQPADGLLPSQAIEQLKRGVDAVVSGEWKSPLPN